MRSKQRGVALLIIALILGLATVGFFFSRFSARNIEQERAAMTVAALAQAKAALIGRAVTDNNVPGSLPCPDLVTNMTNNAPNDGIADMFDGIECPSYVGRLPWRTLRVSDLRDGSGERLWYALSRNFRDYRTQVIINSDTPGQLDISGNYSATNVVAIVFSPGSILPGQARDAANANNLINYLEGNNASGSTNTNYTAAIASSTFNDRLIAITSDNLLPIVEKRVARELASMLRTYANTGNYLYAALLTGTEGVRNNARGRIPRTAEATQPSWTLPGWILENNWDSFIYYSFAPPGENLTVDATNVTAIIIAAGRRLNGTTCNTTDAWPQSQRPTSNICDYLDSMENTNGDNIYRTAPRSPTFNDQIFIVAPVGAP